MRNRFDLIPLSALSSPGLSRGPMLQQGRRAEFAAVEQNISLALPSNAMGPRDKPGDDKAEGAFRPVHELSTMKELSP
jgi:hypothetical protein